MELTYAALSSPRGTVERDDASLGFWQPQAREKQRFFGTLVALADGLKDMNHGDLASRLAVQTSIATFREASGDRSPQILMHRIFNAANHAVYHKGMEDGGNRLSTPLCLVVLRNDEIVAGNAGDSRVYLVRKGETRQISTDHSYLAMQRKFGMISGEEARTRKERSVLIRSVGSDADIRVDPEQTTAMKGDRVVLCSHALWVHVTDGEIAEIVLSLSPPDACRRLVSLAESRGAKESLSIQVLEIRDVPESHQDDGVPMPRETAPQATRYDPQPGQTLDGRFFLTDTISRSGMATIFKATDLISQEEVALKVPLIQYESDPRFYAHFLCEAEMGAQLNHPYLLKFIPVESRSRLYIVTEYLRGYTLAHLLARVHPMPEKDAVRLAILLCEALAHMHGRGVVHRDLKPQNIMVCFDGTIRILDFGLAISTKVKRVTFTAAAGTPEYIAPEQVKGKRGDERTDIYSLGAILYEMVAGAIPFAKGKEDRFTGMYARVTGDPAAPRTLNPELSGQVEEIVLHAMERDPGKRYPTAVAMKADLDAPDEVQLTGRCHRLRAPSPWKRHWKNALMIGLALATTMGGIVKLILMIVRRGP